MEAGTALTGPHVVRSPNEPQAAKHGYDRRHTWRSGEQRSDSREGAKTVIRSVEPGQAGSAVSQRACYKRRLDLAFLRRTRRPEYEGKRPTVRVVDLFSGCGGLSLGLAEAARRLGLGVKVCLAVDSDEDAVAVYRSNFPGAAAIRAPVESYFGGRLGAPMTRSEEGVLEAVGRVDVLIGGPPCQGHSDLNNHTRRDDPRNGLYMRMARAAEVLRPAVVLVENVPPVQHDVERVLGTTMEALEAAGYALHGAVVDLSALGVPQRRRRHVMLASRLRAIRPREVIESLPAPFREHGPRSVGWAISDLAEIEGSIFDSPSKPSRENKKRIAYLFRTGLYDLPNHLRPRCHWSDHSYRSMYGRLRWDEPAQTLTTGFGSMGQGRYVHPLQPRMITPHEAARLQMLPDFFSFAAARTRGALARMIGNCVPPPLAIEIGQQILRPILAKARKNART